jgi:hypothetical protein
VAELNRADYNQLRANVVRRGGCYLVVGGANHEGFVDVPRRSSEIIDAYVAGSAGGTWPGSPTI